MGVYIKGMQDFRQHQLLLLSSALGIEAAKERPCERCEPDTGGRR